MIDFEDFFNIPIIQNFAIDESNSIIAIFMKLEENYDLWKYTIKDKKLEKWISVGEDCYSMVFDSMGNLYITFDEKGDEKKNIYVVAENTSKIQSLKILNENHVGLIYNKFEHTLLYSSNKYQDTYNIYSYDLINSTERPLTDYSESTILLNINLSKKNTEYVSIKHYKNSKRIAYYTHNNDQQSLLPENEEYVVYDTEFFKEDYILFTSNYRSQYAKLFIFDKKDNTTNVFLSEPEIDLKNIYLSKDNKLYIKASLKTQDIFYLYDIETKKLVDLYCPFTHIEKIIIKDKSVYVMGNSSDIPSNIYKYSEGSWRKMLNFNTNINFTIPKVLNFRTEDQIDFETLFFQNDNKKENVLIWLHGGPQSIERNQFNNYHQYFLYNGYDILAPNFRGSTGYGNKFMKLIERNWSKPVLEIKECINFLEGEGYNNIYLIGASYGGYLALISNSFLSTRIQGAVSLYGLTDLNSFIEESSSIQQKVYSRWIGDLVQDKEKLLYESPISHIDKIDNSILLIHGKNDNRINLNQSLKYYAKGLEKQKNIEMLLIEEEGHGFSKKENEMLVYEKIRIFLKDNKQ